MNNKATGYIQDQLNMSNLLDLASTNTEKKKQSAVYSPNSGIDQPKD